MLPGFDLLTFTSTTVAFLTEHCWRGRLVLSFVFGLLSSHAIHLGDRTPAKDLVDV